MKQGIPPAAAIGIIVVVAIVVAFAGYKMFFSHPTDGKVVAPIPKAGSAPTLSGGDEYKAAMEAAQRPHGSPSGYSGPTSAGTNGTRR